MVGNTWFDPIALAAIVSFLLQIVKPLIEAIPAIGTTGQVHDALLRLVLLLLNAGSIVLMAAAAHALRFDVASVAQYAGQAILQAGGGHVAYQFFMAGKVDASSAGVPSVPTSPPGGAAG